MDLRGGSIPLGAMSEAANHDWMAVFAVIWCLGSALLLLRLMREAASISHLVRQAKVGDVRSEVAMEVRFSREVEGPCMMGWRRPCVLLPLEADTWPEVTLRAALRHEWQHARQHDGLHRVCAAVLRAVFWWNPPVHFLCSLYETESEVCCDLEATAADVSRREYGEMLLAHATRIPARGLAMAFARRAGLRGRIERLLAVPKGSRWMLGVRWIVALTLTATAGVLVASIRSLPVDAALETEAVIRLSADPFPASP